MREILFRGKAKAGYKWISEGEWIEGSLFYSDDENGIVCQIATSYLSNNKDEPVMVVAYEVDPETVCQYTGLTDKNGRKIFVGDIVKIGLEHYEVWWNCDSSSITLSSKNESRGLYLSRNETVEVIGNIFDNPELIGEQP